jgi:ribonucleoside-triphosphate reductase
MDYSSFEPIIYATLLGASKNYDATKCAQIVNDISKEISDGIFRGQSHQDKDEIVHFNSNVSINAMISLIKENKSLHELLNKVFITNSVPKAVDELNKILEGVKYDFPEEIETPWGPIGYIVYKRTYSREMEDGTMEEWRDTISRVINACMSQLNVGFTRDEMNRLFSHMMKLKCSVAGRFLWQLGTNTVNRFGILSLMNCTFGVLGPTMQHEYKDPSHKVVKAYCKLFDKLMLGCGMGFSVMRKHISLYPRVLNRQVKIVRKDTHDADFIIPDSREGWVKFLEQVLISHFVTGDDFTFSALLVRSKGSKIKSFGGVASGPDELCVGMAKISALLNSRAGEYLNSVNCLDLACMIAEIVVSGNVRRSSLIAIGDPDDLEYLMAKRFDIGYPSHRSKCNNTVACNDISELPEEFWEAYEGKGECYGLFNLNLCRMTGRVKDGDKYPDPTVEGVNPCGEIPLADGECCCLAEVFLPKVESYEEFVDILKFLYRICKHSMLLPCHWKITEDITRKNMRMGIGITGVCDVGKEKLDWLSDAYEELREYDKEYSHANGMMTSVKLTSVKPSGTLSLLPGVSPGCHPTLYRYYIRRVTLAIDSEVARVCKLNGYNTPMKVEINGELDPRSVMAEFPCRVPDTAIVSDDIDVIQHLEIVKRLQHDWSDNAVSCSIYYEKEDIPRIKEWLKLNYKDNIKTLSFMLKYKPKKDSNSKEDKGFGSQLPYEEITKEQYEEMIKTCKPITSLSNHRGVGEILVECDNGMCPIK